MDQSWDPAERAFEARVLPCSRKNGTTNRRKKPLKILPNPCPRWYRLPWKQASPRQPDESRPSSLHTCEDWYRSSKISSTCLDNKWRKTVTNTIFYNSRYECRTLRNSRTTNDFPNRKKRAIHHSSWCLFLWCQCFCSGTHSIGLNVWCTFPSCFLGLSTTCSNMSQ